MPELKVDANLSKYLIIGRKLSQLALNQKA